MTSRRNIVVTHAACFERSPRDRPTGLSQSRGLVGSLPRCTEVAPRDTHSTKCRPTPGLAERSRRPTRPTTTELRRSHRRDLTAGPEKSLKRPSLGDQTI